MITNTLGKQLRHRPVTKTNKNFRKNKNFSPLDKIKNIDFERMSTSSGLFVQFACTANTPTRNVTESSRNSLLMKHLLKHITRENVHIGDIFQRIKDDITKESGSALKPLLMNGSHRSQQVYLNYVESKC